MIMMTNQEQNHSDKAAFMSKLKESLDMVMNMTDKEFTLHQECDKELEQLKIKYSNMSHELECLKKRYDQIINELEDSKSLNDLQQKNFIQELTKNIMQIGSLQMDALKQQHEHKNVSELAEDLKGENEQLNVIIIQLEEQLKSKQEMGLVNQQKFDAFMMGLREKVESLEGLDATNRRLIAVNRKSNEELQEVRIELITVYSSFCSTRGQIGVKKMGELGTLPFLLAMKKRYAHQEAEARVKATELCSLWAKYLKDPNWHPFTVVTIGGKEKEIIKDDDEKLNGLKNELGEGVYNAVVTALKEMNEYSPRGRRCVTEELWNYKRGRRATLKEGVRALSPRCKHHGLQ